MPAAGRQGWRQARAIASRDLGMPPGGSGLGLSIVREIADACAARIEIDDPPGGGTRFRVRFLAACAEPF